MKVYKHIHYIIKNMHTILCHRGVNRQAENTYSSICDIANIPHTTNIRYGVEFDIVLTKDHTLICYHDETLERCHKLNTRVDELIYDDVIRLGLPLFQDVMEKLAQDTQNTLIDIELKTFNPMPHLISIMCDKVMEICTHYTHIIHRCIFTSFDINIIEYLLKYPKYQNYIALIIFETYNELDINRLYDMGMRNIVMNKELIYTAPTLLSKFKTYLYTWFNIDDLHTGTEQDIIDYLIKYDFMIQCAGFITDNKDAMHKLLCK